MTDISLDKVLADLTTLAFQAGNMITSATVSSSSLDSKKNSADLVTATDRAVEAFVSSSLATLYPDCSFMGEETYKSGDRLTDAPTFVVDPVDGTTNFVHAYPYVSISLGFAVKRDPVVGVIYNPFTRTLYSATKGGGAYRTINAGGDKGGEVREQLPLKGKGKQRELSRLTSLSQALIALEWGSDRSGSDYDVKWKTFAKLCAAKSDDGAMVHGVRSLGSAALNLCAVAEGSLDAYWEGGCWAWDVCAGWVVLKEAGGVIVDGNPGNWDVTVDQRRHLAVRQGVDTEVIEEFWRTIEGRMSYEP